MRAAVEMASAVFVERNVDLQIGVYANAFESDTDDQAANEGLHGTREDLTGDVYSRFACEWADAGASMIGGCCGIGAQHIHTLTNALRKAG
jgi:S-methylmethionine-dependent homocysteine/selenocysteine methylase